MAVMELKIFFFLTVLLIRRLALSHAAKTAVMQVNHGFDKV